MWRSEQEALVNDSPRPRKIAYLSESIQRQLNAYTLSAVAAGVSLLAAQPAEAKIIYNPTHKQLPVNHLFLLDVNHDGATDFQFLLHSAVSTTTQGRRAFVFSLNVKGLLGKIPAYFDSVLGINCAIALPKGTQVGSKQPFKGSGDMFFSGSSGFGGGTAACPWARAKEDAYLGLRFSAKGKVHFGWARFVTQSGQHPKAELEGYAYESIPNKPIIAGKTHGPDVVLERATLGHLAAGASGPHRIPSRR